MSGELDAEGPHDFQLALNGQQFTLLDTGRVAGRGVQLGRHAWVRRPRRRHLSPASGPIQGDTFVTITGVHFVLIEST